MLRTFNRDDGKADDSLVLYILRKTVTASAQLDGGLGSASGHDRAARGVAGVGSGPGSVARWQLTKEAFRHKGMVQHMERQTKGMHSPLGDCLT